MQAEVSEVGQRGLRVGQSATALRPEVTTQAPVKLGRVRRAVGRAMAERTAAMWQERGRQTGTHVERTPAVPRGDAEPPRRGRWPIGRRGG